MPRFALMGGLLSMFLLAGCASPLAPTPPEAPPVTVTLATAGFRVQTVMSAYTAASIDHVTLKVYRAGSLVSSTDVAGSALAKPLTLTNLRMGTSYEVRAEAYQDAASTKLISDSAVSRASLTTPSRTTTAGLASVDSTPISLSLPLKLLNQTFSGSSSFSVDIRSNFNGANTIANVQVRLVRVASNGAETALAAATYALADVSAGQVYRFSNLKQGTTYRLYADAYNASNQVRNTPSLSNVTFTTPAGTGAIDDVIPQQVIPLVK